jgi:cysteine synthase
MIIHSPLDLIFRDLFYRLPEFAGGHDVFLKLEGFNVTGSIKIKTAIALIEDLEQRHRRIVVGKSRSGVELGLCHQGIQIHLRH